MSTAAIRQLNSELADKLVEEAKLNPQSPYVGKKNGIANGQVVIVADNGARSLADPLGLDDLAVFRFLNRFTYDNFGNPLAFGLET